jgi:hypothetical protein
MVRQDFLFFLLLVMALYFVVHHEAGHWKRCRGGDPCTIATLAVGRGRRRLPF